MTKRKNLPLDSKFIIIRDDNQKYGRVYTYDQANLLYRFVSNTYTCRPRVINHFYTEVVLEEILRDSNGVLDYSRIGSVLRFANLEGYVLTCNYRHVKTGIRYDVLENPLNLPTQTLIDMTCMNDPHLYKKLVKFYKEL